MTLGVFFLRSIQICDLADAVAYHASVVDEGVALKEGFSQDVV